MRNLVLAATALTLVAGSAAAVDVKLYGVVNKSLMVHDDGESTETTIVDNNNESTRFGFGGEQKLDNGLTAGVLFEVEQRSNASNALTQAGTGTNHSQANTPASTTPTLDERIARVSLGGAFGTVLLGQQDLATDDAPYHDLAAANSVMNANVAAFGGGLEFRRDTAGTFSALTLAGTDLTPGIMALGQDGALDAADAIRYNSPSFNGVNGSLSVAQGGTMDANVRYNGQMADFTVDGAFGYKWINNNTTTAANELVGQMLTSLSVKHSSGLGATVAYQGRDLDHKAASIEDPNGWYGKVGYNWDSFGVAVDYAHFDNPFVNATDNEMEAMGLGADYDMGNGVVVGALVRNYDAKVTGVSNEEDITVGVVNMRVHF